MNNNNYYYPRLFQGIWIPSELYYNKELTWLEKILLLDIESNNYDEDNTYSLIEIINIDYLCSLLSISEDILINMISKLIELGYIVEYTNSNNKHSFSIKLDPRRLNYEE